MKSVLVLATVVVLLALMVSSVSANIVGEPPRPNSEPTDQFSLNNIITEPPRPTSVASDGIELMEIRGSSLIRSSGG